MCTRKTQKGPRKNYTEVLQIDVTGRRVELPKHNLAPGDISAVAWNDEDGRRMLDGMRWGFAQGQWPNARSETVHEKPAFRHAFAARRCLVPADAFFEWKSTPSGKQPYCFQFASGEPMVFAGLYEESGNDTWFTVLMTQANKRVAEYHATQRMPVVLAPEQFDRWLDTTTGNNNKRDAVADLFNPYAAEAFTVHPADPRMNSSRNKDVDTLTPYDPPQMELF